MLHVTNGDLAAERIAAAVEGDVLPWRDVLHEGPVPPDADDEALRDARAHFVAGCGWAEHASALDRLVERDRRMDAAREEDEIVLWFEPDLYDQLQLLQVLDRLARPDLARVRVTAVAATERMGALEERETRALHARRASLPAGARDAGRRAWAAFRAPDPRAIEALARAPDGILPFLPPAFRRLLEELPWTRDGLARSERQALEAVRPARLTAARAFLRSHHAREERVYLGDTVFFWILDRLASGSRPLLDVDPAPAGATSRVSISDDGRAVLEGRADWIAIGGSDRWLGGVHLEGSVAEWRWDPAAERVIRSRASPPGRGSGH